jgi:penicillin-binding protein 1A
MTEIHKDLPNKGFEKPDGLVRVTIDTKSGKRATELSKEAGHIRNEYFIKGTAPTEYDDVHVKAVVCSESGKLATEYCPDDLIGSQIFIKRPIPYKPEEHNGIIPRDYTNELPTEYCDIHTSIFNRNNFNNPIENLPLGTIVLPNGTKIFPDGTKLLIDGTIIYPDGTIKSKLDNILPDNIDLPDINLPNIIDSDDNSLIDSND